MTSAAKAFNHRELEIFEKDINAQVVSSENRIEKSIMSLQSAMKDMELRLVREIHSIKDELNGKIEANKNEQRNDILSIKEDIAELKAEVKTIKSNGRLLVTLVSLVGVLVGIFSALPKILALWH